MTRRVEIIEDKMQKLWLWLRRYESDCTTVDDKEELAKTSQRMPIKVVEVHCDSVSLGSIIRLDTTWSSLSVKGNPCRVLSCHNMWESDLSEIKEIQSVI